MLVCGLGWSGRWLCLGRSEAARCLLRAYDSYRFTPTAGSLLVLGRVDQGQAKVGGVRVDLLAVERFLLGCDGVAEAAVRAWQHPRRPQDSLLAAYIVAKQQQQQQQESGLISRLQAAAAAALQPPARPTSYTLLPSLPRSAAGKLLRLQLPMLPAAAGGPVPTDQTHHHQQQQQQQAQLPASEAQVMAAFVAALGGNSNHPGLEATSDFFTSGGGDSLAAAAVAGALGIDVRLVFAHPTARALAAALRPTEEQRGASAEKQRGAGDEAEGLFPAAKRRRLVVDVERSSAAATASPAVSHSLPQLLSHATHGTVISSAGIVHRGGLTGQHAMAAAHPDTPISSLQVAWHQPLGLCIDAAPQLVVLQAAGTTTTTTTTNAVVLACSHSGEVACFDAATGTAFWRAQLPGRCDAGLAVELRLRELAVACSGGVLRSLDLGSGAVLREVECGGELRSAPAVDPSGRWWVAGHGQQLVVMEPGEGGTVLRCVWGGGGGGLGGWLY